jgi:hypothetical protein
MDETKLPEPEPWEDDDPASDRQDFEDEIEDEDSEAEFADDEQPLGPVEGYEAYQFDDDLPEGKPVHWLPLIGNCLFGSAVGAAIAGVLANQWPPARQAKAFFLLFLVCAIVCSFLWHWGVYLRGSRIEKKLKDEEENPAGSPPIHPE